MKLSKALFNMLGLSSLFGCAFITLFMLFRIATQGYFMVSEPDRLILYIEIIFVIFSLSYVVFLFKRFAWDKK